MDLRQYWSAAPRRAKMGVVAGGVFSCMIGIWAINAKAGHTANASHPSSVAVNVAKVAIQNVPISVTALGQAQAWQSVTIHAQVNGVLTRLDFHEGGNVAAGSVVAEIDPTPYKAALQQAQGQYARDLALLENARLDLARYQKLLKEDSIAEQQVATQVALVAQDEGLVASDKGTMAAAQVNVQRCKITSPISGRAGVRLVDAGNLVSSTDQTGIVSVNQISPIAVTFTIPQGDFQRLSDVSQGFSVALKAQALSQETGALLGSGELAIADNHVDQATGTVLMKARFANADKRLWPGQFVNVKLLTQTLLDAATIPAAAVNQGPKGPYVYVVGYDRKAQVRSVVVAAVQDSTAVITSGLRRDETVVTDGQMSLRPGIAVNIRRPAPGKKPTP